MSSIKRLLTHPLEYLSLSLKKKKCLYFYWIYTVKYISAREMLTLKWVSTLTSNNLTIQIRRIANLIGCTLILLSVCATFNKVVVQPAMTVGTEALDFTVTRIMDKMTFRGWENKNISQPCQAFLWNNLDWSRWQLPPNFSYWPFMNSSWQQLLVHNSVMLTALNSTRCLA